MCHAVGDSEAVLGPGDQVMSGQLSPQYDATISIPASLFQMITDRTNVGVFFAFYDTPTLFPVGGGSNVNSDAPRQIEVGSHVIATTVGPGLNFQNLVEPITIMFRQQVNEGKVRLVMLGMQDVVNDCDNIQFIAPGSERCVSWDFDLQDWTPQGCTTSVGQNGTVTCHCSHFTNFAILVVSGTSYT